MQKLIIRLTGITFLLFFISQSGFSQDDDELLYNRSFGIDLTFINNFLPFDNNIGFRDEHLFHFFKYKEDRKFSRHAFDFDIFGNFQNNEVDPNSNTRRLDIDYKFSKGKRKKIFKKGSLFYGPELLLGYFYNQRVINDSSSNIGNSTVTDHIISTSIGPFVGFEFKFSKRFAVYTEAGAYLNFNYAIDVFESEQFPTQNFNDKNFSISNTFNFPSSIILLYYF